MLEMLHVGQLYDNVVRRLDKIAWGIGFDFSFLIISVVLTKIMSMEMCDVRRTNSRVGLIWRTKIVKAQLADPWSDLRAVEDRWQLFNTRDKYTAAKVPLCDISPRSVDERHRFKRALCFAWRFYSTIGRTTRLIAR